MSHPWPETEVAAAIVQRLRAGDPLASADFAEAFLDPLTDWLRANNPHVNEHDRLTAAEDAVLSVIRNPASYDPAKSELAAYLRMAARNDLRNILEREKRHGQRRESADSVELLEDHRNSGDEDAGEDLPSFDEAALASVIAAFTETERRVFELMRAGERRTEAFAAVLGMGELPAAEQKREVKRMKDRILARLKRARRET